MQHDEKSADESPTSFFVELCKTEKVLKSIHNSYSYTTLPGVKEKNLTVGVFFFIRRT